MDSFGFFYPYTWQQTISEPGNYRIAKNPIQFEYKCHSCVLYYLCNHTYLLMRPIICVLLMLFALQISVAQQNTRWKGYFSYNEVRDLSQSPNRLYVASENALFSLNVNTNELKTINTIDGLPSESISAMYYSASANKTLIGYRNGLMIVRNEADGNILKVVDIINKQIPPNIKKINHFLEVDGMVYIACDFGVVVYNLSTLQFGDTYFLGIINPELAVTQTAILNGYLYAATLTEGIRRGELANPNLIDATEWQQLTSGSFVGITEFDDNLFALNSSGQVSRSTNGIGFSSFGPLLPTPPVDIRSSGSHLVISCESRVLVYDQDQVQIAQIFNNNIPEPGIVFSCATSINDRLFLGTRENGVVTISVNGSGSYEFLSPNGPIRNNIFSINASTSNLWAVYGGYDETFNPDPLQYYGIDKYNKDDGWKYIPFEETGSANNLVRVTVHPTNENVIYVSSYHSGLVKLENDTFANLYNETNSGLESLVVPGAPTFKSVRIEQSAFDSAGNLWMTNGLLEDPLKVLRANGSWQSFEIKDILANFFDARFGRLVVDKNGTKWMSTRSDGVIAFNETYTNKLKKITTGESGNLPSERVQVTAIDKRNQLWIGTADGLRILSSVDRFSDNDSQLNASAIVIEEEGLGRELMADQFITDIVVDGANNKWIGTLDAGVFQFSPNGQKTLQQFNTSNSPLPSNAINDIDINPDTGEVFFATASGMVSFRGDAISASDNLNNVVVYPNPVRPGYAGTVKITGLLDNATVKITDIEGSLVFETRSQGGTIEWDTTAFGKYKVASGVYMIFISSEDGMETKVKKVMIVR